MRGRTNINGSGNAVVNGESKEFVVADGETVGKGGFVQASYKSRVNSTLFNNTIYKAMYDMGGGECIIIYRNGDNPKSIMYAAIFKFVDNELIRISNPVETGVAYTASDYASVIKMKKINDNIYCFTYYLYTGTSSDGDMYSYGVYFLGVNDNEIVDVANFKWDNMVGYKTNGIEVFKFNDDDTTFGVMAFEESSVRFGSKLFLHIGNISFLNNEIILTTLKDVTVQEELNDGYDIYLFEQYRKENETLVSCLYYRKDSIAIFYVYKVLITRKGEDFEITSERIDLGSSYDREGGFRIVPIVQDEYSGDVALWEYRTGESGKSATLYNCNYVNLGTAGKWFGYFNKRISPNEIALFEYKSYGTPYSLNAEVGIYNNEIKTVTWSNKAEIGEISNDIRSNPYGILNIGDNNYLLLSGKGYIAFHYEEKNVSKGMTENLNTVKPYNGTNKAMGFAKTGGNSGETVKVYVPWEDN